MILASLYVSIYGACLLPWSRVWGEAAHGCALPLPSPAPRGCLGYSFSILGVSQVGFCPPLPACGGVYWHLCWMWDDGDASCIQQPLRHPRASDPLPQLNLLIVDLALELWDSLKQRWPRRGGNKWCAWNQSISEVENSPKSKLCPKEGAPGAQLRCAAPNFARLFPSRRQENLPPTPTPAPLS